MTPTNALECFAGAAAAAVLLIGLGSCTDPNRVAGTTCTEPTAPQRSAGVDDLAAYLAAEPPPPCYYLPTHPRAKGAAVTPSLPSS